MKTFEERRTERREEQAATIAAEMALETRRATIAQRLSDDITEAFDGAVAVRLDGHHLALSRTAGDETDAVDIWVNDEWTYGVGARDRHIVIEPQGATRDQLLDLVDRTFGHR